jgi:hypothetical protein
VRYLSIPFALLLVHCSTQDSICSKQADCFNWNNATQDACEEELEGEDEIASEYDCEDQFSNLMSCIDDTGSCKVDPKDSKANKYESSCTGQRDALQSCQKAAREKAD